MVVRLEADDAVVQRVAKRAREALVKGYMDAGKSAEEAAKMADAASIKFSRAEDRKTSALERHLAVLGRQAAIAGKTGIERLIALRDHEIRQLGSNEAAIQRVNAAYGQMISAQRSGGESARSFGQSIGGAVAQIGGAVLTLEAMRRVLKATAVDTAFVAARQNTLGVALEASAVANDISARSIRQQEQAITRMGITTSEARQALLRMITAQIDFTKSSHLARLAQDAAVIGNMNSSEAFEHMIYGIQSGQPRILRTIGMNVNFQESYERLAKSIGKTTLELSDQEKVQARTNEVLRLAPRFAGIYEAAMTDVGKRMTSLKRYFEEASAAVGQQFQPALRAAVDTLTEFLKLIEAHPEVGTGVGVATTGGLAALGTRWLLGAGAAKAVGVAGIVAGQLAVGRAATQRVGEWIGLGLGGETEAAAGAARELPGISAAARAQGLRDTTAAIRAETEKQIAQKRMDAWQKYYSGLRTEEAIHKRIQQTDKQAEEAAGAYDIAGYERAMRSRAGFEAQLKAMKDVEHMRTVLAELNVAAGKAELDYFQQSYGWLEKLSKLKMTGAQQIQASSDLYRIAAEEEYDAVKKILDEWYKLDETTAQWHQRVMAPEIAAGLKKQAELTSQIAGGYLGYQRAGIERRGEAALRLAGARYGPGEERAGIEETYRLRLAKAAELAAFDQEQASKMTDAAKRIDAQMDISWRTRAAEEEASFARMADLASLEKRRFENLKSSFEGLFDALLTRSQSVLGAIGSIFKAAILTPIKEVMASWVAGLLMPMYGGRGAAGGGGGNLGAMRGGLFGVGAGFGMGVPGFPGSNAAAGMVEMAPGVFWPASGWGWGQGASNAQRGLFGGLSWQSAGQAAALLGGTALASKGIQRKNPLMTVGGTAALGIGAGMMLGTTPLWGAVTGAGAGLAIAGLQRGGLLGLGMTTGGGALLGLQFGGPVGAAIGAGAGFVAGLIRMFIKGAEEKAREKILALYGVTIRETSILNQIVQTAKSSYGGDLDLAIRSPGIRDLIELYAMSKGQKVPWRDANRPFNMVQVGGALYQSPTYLGGTPYVYPSALPTLGGSIPNLIAGGMAPAAGGPVEIVNVNIDGQPVASITMRNGRIAAQAVAEGMRASVSRRQIAALALSPNTLTA